MNKSFQYNCCFCGKSGNVIYDEPDEMGPLFVGLLKMLPRKIACERCANYERGRRDLFSAIRKRVLWWEQKSIEERNVFHDKVFKRLEIMFQKLCRVYSIRYNQRVPYDEQMVAIPMQTPGKLETVLERIHQMARTI